jgi:hypothetical protein
MKNDKKKFLLNIILETIEGFKVINKSFLNLPLQNTCFFARPDSAIVTIFHTMRNPARLFGLSHLDNFIVTYKSCPLIGTAQRLMPTQIHIFVFIKK